MGWGCGDRWARCWSIARGEIVVDFVAYCRQLAALELGNADAAPSFGGANERGVDQLQDSALAKGMRDHLGASAGLAKQSLEQIGGADHPAMAEREAQMRNARLKVVVETRHRRGQVLAVGRREVVAQQARQCWRGRLVASRGAHLELRPDVFGHLAL